jgi:hypothetical protein
MTTSIAFLRAVSEQIRLAEREAAQAAACGDDAALSDAAGRLADLREIARRNAAVPVKSLLHAG